MSARLTADSDFQRNLLFEKKFFEKFSRIVPGSAYILEAADSSMLVEVPSGSTVENVFKLGLKEMFISLSGRSKILLYNEYRLLLF